MKVKELRMLYNLSYKVIYQHFFYAFYSSRAISQNTHFNTHFRRLYLKVIVPNCYFFATFLLCSKVKVCHVIYSKIANFPLFQLFFLAKFLCFPTKNYVSNFLCCFRMSLSMTKKLLPKIIIILKDNHLKDSVLREIICFNLIILYS